MVIDHAVLDARRLPATDHHIHTGMDLESGRMAGVDKGLEIVEIRRAFPETPAVPDPAWHLAQRRGHGGGEQHVPAGGPYVHDDVREAHFRNPPAVPADGIGIVPVAPEIRRGVDPEEAGLFSGRRGSARAQKDGERSQQKTFTDRHPYGRKINLASVPRPEWMAYSSTTPSPSRSRTSALDWPFGHSLRIQSSVLMVARTCGCFGSVTSTT